MKYSVLYALICVLLLSCSDKMKFSQEIWFREENSFFPDNRREKMIDDVVDSYLETYPKYDDVVAYLGNPDRIDSLNVSISYIVFSYIISCPLIIDEERKFLDIKFDEDSVVSEVKFIEYGRIKKTYVLNKN